jgi:predicted kinase
MQRHLIHLICGSTGAGKTTYALQLADRLGAVRFSIDDWMSALFWMDSPQPLNPAWSMERVERCLAQIWAVARRVAERDVPCVLDVGLTRAESRTRFARLAGDVGLSVQLHFVDAPMEERWRRVEVRNAKKGDTYQLGFDVTREMFEFVESIWEPPTDDEILSYDGVRISAKQVVGISS